MSGNYCLTKNLTTAATVLTGNAVTVNVDNVVLDLNGFELESGATAATITVNGVSGTNRKNVTVTNGTIRGFHRGVHLPGTGSGNLADGLLAG